MKILPWGLFLVMFFATGFTIRQLVNERRGAEIAHQNLLALADSTQRALRDEIEASTRRAVQATLRAEDATAAMGAALDERDASLVALSRMEVRVAALVRQAQIPIVDTVIVEGVDTVRVATFTHQGPPIEGEQTVRVGPRITLDSRLRVTPFSISYGLACAGTAPVFTWDTPEWVSTTFDQGTVDPGVCYTPAPSLFEISTGKVLWLILGLGLGLGGGAL